MQRMTNIPNTSTNNSYSFNRAWKPNTKLSFLITNANKFCMYNSCISFASIWMLREREILLCLSPSVAEAICALCSDSETPRESASIHRYGVEWYGNWTEPVDDLIVVQAQYNFPWAYSPMNQEKIKWPVWFFFKNIYMSFGSNLN